MIAYSVDLLAFTWRKIDWIRYKLFLDVVSIALIIAVQAHLFSVDYTDEEISVVQSGPSQS